LDLAGRTALAAVAQILLSYDVPLKARPMGVRKTPTPKPITKYLKVK